MEQKFQQLIHTGRCTWFFLVFSVTAVTATNRGHSAIILRNSEIGNCDQILNNTGCYEEYEVLADNRNITFVPVDSNNSIIMSDYGCPIGTGVLLGSNVIAGSFVSYNQRLGFSAQYSDRHIQISFGGYSSQCEVTYRVQSGSFFKVLGQRCKNTDCKTTKFCLFCTSCASCYDGCVLDDSGLDHCVDPNAAAPKDTDKSDDSCAFAHNGHCDETSGWCAVGTDSSDCTENSDDSCVFAMNGHCDETSGLCPMGTDSSDCAGGTVVVHGRRRLGDIVWENLFGSNE